MAKGGGRRSRMDLRREAEAVEAREKDDEKDEKDDEEEEEEADADAESDADEGDGDDDEEGGKKKKKKPAKKPAAKKPAAKKTTTKRTRAAKEVRQRAVWVVFDNAQKRVETFPYNQKAEAEDLLARKIEEKKGTFYLNLVKEEINE